MKKIISFVLVFALVFSIMPTVMANAEDEIITDFPSEISLTYQEDTGFEIVGITRSNSESEYRAIAENGYYRILGEHDFPENLRLRISEDGSSRLVASEKVTIDLCDDAPYEVLINDYDYDMENPMIQELEQLRANIADESSQPVIIYVGAPSVTSTLADSSYTTTWKGRTIRDDSYTTTAHDTDGGFTILTFGNKSTDATADLLNDVTIQIDWNSKTRSVPAILKNLGKWILRLTLQKIREDIATAGTTKPYVKAYTRRETTKIFSYVLDNGTYYLGCIVGMHDFSATLTYYDPSSIPIQGAEQTGTLKSPLWGSTARLDKAIASYDPNIGGYNDLPSYVYISVTDQDDDVKNYRRSW